MDTNYYSLKDSESQVPLSSVIKAKPKEHTTVKQDWTAKTLLKMNYDNISESPLDKVKQLPLGDFTLGSQISFVEGLMLSHQEKILHHLQKPLWTILFPIPNS